MSKPEILKKTQFLKRISWEQLLKFSEREKIFLNKLNLKNQNKKS